jgi:carbonic anhydrase
VAGLTLLSCGWPGRVAGNVLNEHSLASIAFAVETLGAKLIVVMAHSKCASCALAVQVGGASG